MKYFKTAPPVPIIRVNVKKQGEKTKHINLSETTSEEVLGYIRKAIFSKNLSPFQKGFSTSVEVREALGGENLKSQSISFKGMSVQDTYDLIKAKLDLEVINQDIRENYKLRIKEGRI